MVSAPPDLVSKDDLLILYGRRQVPMDSVNDTTHPHRQSLSQSLFLGNLCQGQAPVAQTVETARANSPRPLARGDRTLWVFTEVCLGI